jgi:hypothetical protein
VEGLGPNGDLGDDAALLGEWGQGNQHRIENVEVDVLLCCGPRELPQVGLRGSDEVLEIAAVQEF